MMWFIEHKDFMVFITSALSLAFGFFTLLKPHLVIELQKRFYEKINWRMEPISLPKEIRNTKAMGAFLIVFVLICWFLFFLKDFYR